MTPPPPFSRSPARTITPLGSKHLLALAGLVLVTMVMEVWPPGSVRFGSTTILWFLIALSLLPLCCTRRSAKESAGWDVFQPGSIVAIYFIAYVLIPAY